jgi:nanoRNase/pAp phosphatase (c-di-AMP/oligoRNAs hydrolase)
MFFGIQTDTDDSRTRPGRCRAAAYLKPFVDAETLSASGVARSPKRWGDWPRAQDIEVVRDFAIAGVGHVSAVNHDAIPMAADFVLRREDIDTVLVFGIVEDRNRVRCERAARASTQPSSARTLAGRRAPVRRRAPSMGFRIPLGLLSEVEEKPSSGLSC